MVEIDWAKIGEMGLGVVALIAITFIVVKFIEAWQKSNDAQIHTADALAKNAQAYDKLAHVFEQSSEREREFEREALRLLQENAAKTADTHRRVREMHQRMLEHGEGH